LTTNRKVNTSKLNAVFRLISRWF